MATTDSYFWPEEQRFYANDQTPSPSGIAPICIKGDLQQINQTIFGCENGTWVVERLIVNTTGID
jgi:hypothetical protein